MGWKTPYLMIQKGANFGVQAISAPGIVKKSVVV